MTAGKIIMLPVPIGPESEKQYYTTSFIGIVKNTKIWVAENARTLRRWISSLDLSIVIPDLTIFELDRDFTVQNLEIFLNEHIEIGDIAVTSEAGLPGMADPGNVVAKWAHAHQIQVNSWTGPGSIYLALCASGFNGQQFTFHGYCPIKDDELNVFFKRLLKDLKDSGYTQIFIETPYRNDRILEKMIRDLPPSLNLCVASALHHPNETVKTQSLKAWAESKTSLGKVPCVFLIGN